jgi:hypothetical protein
VADITGFTKLTEILSKKGSTGVELLTNCINHYFGKVCLSSLRAACFAPSASDFEFCAVDFAAFAFSTLLGALPAYDVHDYFSSCKHCFLPSRT